MAKLSKTSPLHGMSGLFGRDLMFRQVNGETVISFYSAGKKKKSSELQKRNRDKFGEASRFAKAQMRIAERKEYYQKLAKKLKLPNAYTAAITEFMRKPEIDEVKTEKLKRGGLKVKVKAYKRGYEMKEVKVAVRCSKGRLTEYTANRRGNCFWELELKEGDDVQIEKVEGWDKFGNVGMVYG